MCVPEQVKTNGSESLSLDKFIGKENWEIELCSMDVRSLFLPESLNHAQWDSVKLRPGLPEGKLCIFLWDKDTSVAPKPRFLVDSAEVVSKLNGFEVTYAEVDGVYTATVSKRVDGLSLEKFNGKGAWEIVINYEEAIKLINPHTISKWKPLILRPNFDLDEFNIYEVNADLWGAPAFLFSVDIETVLSKLKGFNVTYECVENVFTATIHENREVISEA